MDIIVEIKIKDASYSIKNFVKMGPIAGERIKDVENIIQRKKKIKIIKVKDKDKKKKQRIKKLIKNNNKIQRKRDITNQNKWQKKIKEFMKHNKL